MNSYKFADGEKAIDIYNPTLPQPWIHYLSNGRLHAFASQAGGGFAWWRDPVGCRLTRYRTFNLPPDRPGYYIYIKENQKRAWNPTFQPMQTQVENYVCRFSPGMASYHAENSGVAATQKLFVTPGEDLLVMDLSLKNTGDEEKELSVFAYLELAQMKWLTEQEYGYYWRHMLRTWREESTNTLCYLYQFTSKDDTVEFPLVFFGASEPMTSLSTDRDAFCGDYRDEGNPIAVENGVCGGETMLSGEPCFAAQNRVVLKPGESRRLMFYLGCAPRGLKDINGAKKEMERLCGCANNFSWVDSQTKLIEKEWENYLGKFECHIPNKDLERQINIWSPINCMVTARFSRSVNTNAPGVRGIGYRDSAQDMTATAMRRCDMATDMLMCLLSKQFKEGCAVHLIPLGKSELPDAKTRCDSHLWLPMLLYSILSETGDFSLLDKEVPYLSREDLISEQGSATVWEHMLAAVDFTQKHLGEHGLPLTLKGDWNDIIGKFSEKGRGESTFAAMQYLTSLKLLAEIAEIYDTKSVEFLTECANRQKAAIEKNCFSEKWWCRCFDDNGKSIGTPSSEHGKLWLNPQSWAVISGVGNEEQRRMGLDAAYENLRTDVGLKLITPGFPSYPETTDPFVGYNPGNGENGAIFCHANGWAIIAEAMMGNGERAWEYFSMLTPHLALNKMGLKTYRAEPFAWVSNIVGPENPKYGWANVSQVTGTAAWMEIAATQVLLGVRAGLDGLTVNPVIPGSWKELSVRREYRGTEVLVEIENPSGVCCGVKRLELDGKELGGNFISAELLRGKKEVCVKLVMGQ